jgi:hypothetical protein
MERNGRGRQRRGGRKYKSFTRPFLFLSGRRLAFSLYSGAGREKVRDEDSAHACILAKEEEQGEAFGPTACRFSVLLYMLQLPSTKHSIDQRLNCPPSIFRLREYDRSITVEDLRGKGFEGETKAAVRVIF